MNIQIPSQSSIHHIPEVEYQPHCGKNHISHYYQQLIIHFCPGTDTERLFFLQLDYPFESAKEFPRL